MRLSLIDDTNRGAHSRLTEADPCYHLFEYTSGHNFEFSRTNQLIYNLKKKPSHADRPDYKYKAVAIAQCAEAFRAALNPSWLETATLVPVPCSKARDHPDYDDRMERICRQIAPNLDVRCMIEQVQSTNASHSVREGERNRIEELLEIYRGVEALADPAPRVIAIVDDVLTSGTHYRAVQIRLVERFPNVPIVGLFVARRVFG
jgi:predicted amidophosphoribosyltransferase